MALWNTLHTVQVFLLKFWDNKVQVTSVTYSIYSNYSLLKQALTNATRPHLDKMQPDHNLILIQEEKEKQKKTNKTKPKTLESY